jgi:mono/diheme cytochrome c family protein
MRAILACLFLCTALSAARAAEPSAETIARGQALVDAGDCASCHTADSTKPFAGGVRIETPFGAITTPNLTPDRDTGIGAWSEQDFYSALRLGIAPDGSPYYPAFPYPYFAKLTRDDIFAIRAYLGTLTPYTSKTPPPELRFPLNFRVVMRFWNYLFFRPGIIVPDQGKGTEWNRGRYLVEALGHCGACHTPKNLFGADRRNRAYAGGLVDGWFAPRLDAAERSGLASWKIEDVVEYLSSGRNRKSHAGGPMAEVVVNSTSKMSDADVRAIAVYLKSLRSGNSEPLVMPPSETAMASGKAVYDHYCVACHEADGSSSPGVYPPLDGNALLQSADPSSTLRVILDGAQSVTTARAPNTGQMPAYARQFSDQEVADVTTYIRNSFGNSAPAVSAEQVKKARQQ